MASSDNIKMGKYMKGNFTRSQNICLNIHSVPSVSPLGSAGQETVCEGCLRPLMSESSTQKKTLLQF